MLILKYDNSKVSFLGYFVIRYTYFYIVVGMQLLHARFYRAMRMHGVDTLLQNAVRLSLCPSVTCTPVVCRIAKLIEHLYSSSTW